MDIRESILGDVTVISISGRIDLTSVGELEARLNKAIDVSSMIVIDLEETAYISSSGLRVLLAGLKRLGRQNGHMRLAAPQLMVRNVLEISGLCNLFSIQRNLKEALDSLQAVGKIS
ncbi:MAG: STAS domain protein [Methanosaeta sp. PtaB.Bin039]|nr:MAG: STAS domain protein [Methanosaeta sp. PtaB.Bin039]OPY47006.1 MAG: STAS domain protein [Methanosaeta sp. PtaU1.Bin028]HOT07070.1 STAS domain-containing protein [Methanotrichaceae archaeon]HQF17095.1 STAS domain-containing protein [Methanotrichaceae archaeon]HQI91716.1 STAS domain-containing protein [Methanotrichaceae archaeon]